MSGIKIGEPLEPFNQLMAVLPPRSSNVLPKAYRNLMISEDSPLVKFYPKDYVLDLDGKRFVWQGICKLPFIDEEMLLAATKNVEKDLEIGEVSRNSVGKDKIFVRESHCLGSQISSCQTMSHAIDPKSCDINGYISSYHRSTIGVMNNTGVEDHTLTAFFENPDFRVIIPRLLMSEDSRLPERKITEADIVERRLWHTHEKFQHPVTPADSWRKAQRNEDKSKPSSSNDRERWFGAGSGWSGRSSRTGWSGRSSGRPDIAESMRSRYHQNREADNHTGRADQSDNWRTEGRTSYSGYKSRYGSDREIRGDRW